MIVWVLLLPFRLVNWFRRSMTVASGTLLVVSIASLNIIWGYPWLGIFSAAISLFILGRLLSSLMSPKLDYHLALPRSVPHGFPLPIAIKCINRGRLPAMQFLISFDQRSSHSGRSLRRRRVFNKLFEAISPPQPITLLESGKTGRVTSTLRFTSRGTHSLPFIITQSYFPFYLFQVTQRIDPKQEITVTPRPLDADEDESSRGFLESMGEWSHQLLAGDALDYTGSREYEYGMPVRRWDFVSWARLGKPIVREYQSPSIQQVYLIVDTSHEASGNDSQGKQAADFEHLLSAATTTILELGKKRVSLHFCLTCQQDRHSEEGGFTQIDSESMLIRLANANVTETESTDQQIEAALESAHQSPTLILSNRNSESYPYPLPRTVNWIQLAAPDKAQQQTLHAGRER